MSARQLFVYLDGTRAGVLEMTASGNVTFEYDDDYRSRPDPTPLSLSMPLVARSHKKRVVLPFLQGLLPDSEEALRAIGRQYGVSPRSPFAMLEHVGADVAGAIQIVATAEQATDAQQRVDDLREVSDDDVAAMLGGVVAEYVDGERFYGGVGRFSLAGAQPKIALNRLEGGAWAIAEGGTPTTHILKPVASTFRRLDVVEYVTMRAARQLGNMVADSELVTIGDWNVFVSERYDRVRVDGRLHRRHQEDLCQALSVSPEKKYQHRDGGPGLGEIARLLASLPFDEDRRLAGERFYRASVFNIVAGCTDAHAKNYSVLLQGRSVELAPLYDLTSYAAYWDGSARLDSAMNVAGEYSFDRISVEALVAAGKKFGLAPDTADSIVQHTRDKIVGAFEQARQSLPTEIASVSEVCDALLAGVARLPLVC